MEMEDARIAVPSCLEGTQLKSSDFIWPESDRPYTSFFPSQDPAMAVGFSNEIQQRKDLEFPEVDLSLPDEEILSILRCAASSWGFFRVRNHGIPQDLFESIARHASDFFGLQLSEKRAISRVPPLPLGYTSIERSSDIKSWSEALHLMPGRDKICSLLHQVPSFREPHSFSSDVDKYFSLVGALANRIIRLLFQGLQVDAEQVDAVFNSIESSTLRINYYPACPVADFTYGSPPHKDYGGLAILHQDDVGGLEVLKDGCWVPVLPVKGCLIVNVGELIQIVSNGRFPSVLHRSLVKCSQSRLSFVFFYFPSDDTWIGPIPKLITEDCPAKYKSFYMRDYKSVFGKAQKAHQSPSLFFQELTN
ncbi:hypothetical protein KP509_28G053400 [Ceratopteris richardii]|uniref:Fe2OG dioxygenase domain-containing protein n=1 Tax=Ceratopteris richardii TaxID=49495 RepID=A0A8T2RE09_CERRI|nr:hypothetical protein KP509_28G053400 [Ceratopteris richardii]